jgi:hypothetical protein
MRIMTRILLVLCVTMLCEILPSPSRADELNTKALITFDGPVQIPGRVLPAGTYVFRLEDSIIDRNIVEIWTGDDMHLLATIMAVPTDRTQAEDKTAIKFEARDPDAPLAIKAWFRPGYTTGEEFVYSNPSLLSSPSPQGE